MLRSHTTWLVPVALTLVGFGASAAPAIAQTTLSFNADYEVVNNFTPLTSPDVQPFYAQANPIWSSDNAPYGLTQLGGIVYAELNFNAGIFTFTENPGLFGLQDLPSGPLVLGGEGPNRLFMTDIATGVLDPESLVATTNGVLAITGGEGIFEGATGTLNFTEIGALSLGPDVPFIARSSVTGSIQVLEVVPEPRTDIGLLVGMGMIGSGVLLRRRSRRSTREYISVVNPSAK